MCYDISFKVKLEQLLDYFPELMVDPQLNVPWPEYPHLLGPDDKTVRIPIVFRDKQGVLRCRVMEWGVILHDNDSGEPSKEERNFNLNIMSEKIFQKNSQWYAIRWQICLIPMTGTFEHRGILKWAKKVPYFIKPK